MALVERDRVAVRGRQRVLEGDSSIDKSVAAALKMYFHSSKIQYEQRGAACLFIVSTGCTCCCCCCCFCCRVVVAVDDALAEPQF